jgi:3-oxoacyl-[acyl-carrier protein] reductase
MSEVMVITGTSKGIGRYLAEYYITKGYRVTGCSRSSAHDYPPGYEHHYCDVANEQDVRLMIDSIYQRHGRIDILINNAGIASMNHLLLTPFSTVKQVFATNVFGAFLLIREVAKKMTKVRYGRIVNFATVATPLNLEGEATYAASKAAVESLTRVSARELAPFNITVNAVGPTPVETDLIRGVPSDKIQALLQQQAISRLGEFPDISNVIDFFIRRESEFITGQVLYLGGVS